ncbi:hypothetical protein H2201_008243 [Coniosporium apollinis]|uniref:Aminoglycoside phosphotransferase domain-containing protein n=1 Tax=Coniosporium apollinis TaxID=61459 RepID=A0ABQ9NH43_9PEZI|nr:hypothetical protein H2201_008243 [Coniosporium apollinis]
MDSTEERDLTPSDDILQNMFGEHKPAKLEILAQTFQSCTFSVHTSETSSSYHLKDLLVRLELSSGRLQAVAELQRLAYLHIPELVPKTFDLGTVTTADGRQLDYSVTQFVAGTTVLESVWQDLDDDQQAALMNSVVDAVTKIQRLKLDDKPVQATLSATAYIFGGLDTGTSIQHPLGGPELGYLRDTAAFLAGIIKANSPKSPTSSIVPSLSGDGITMTSTYDNLGSVHIPQSDLDFLQQHSIFCYNDLEPRNLLVRAVDVADGKQTYELAAIIDWEMAGFYPFAYEYCVKDSVLGSSNLYLSWYTLFKQRTAALVPAHRFSEALIRVVDLIYRSREADDQERCVRDGWVRRADAGTVPKFTKEDNQKLEEDVLRALVDHKRMDAVAKKAMTCRNGHEVKLLWTAGSPMTVQDNACDGISHRLYAYIVEVTISWLVVPCTGPKLRSIHVETCVFGPKAEELIEGDILPGH